MKLSSINESNTWNDNWDGSHHFKLKDGRHGTITIRQDDRIRRPYLGSIKMQATVNGEDVGEFILGFWEEGGGIIRLPGKPIRRVPKRVIAQMDIAKVKEPFRRLGIASAAYDIAEKIVSSRGATFEQTSDVSQDARSLWRSRQG